MTIPDSFTTERLRAERMQESHYDELRVLHQDAQMMAMIGGLRDVAGTVAYLDRHLAHWHRHGFGFFMLREVDGGVSIGLAGVRRLRIDTVDELEMGYGFLPAFWGKGLATEIGRECARLAFDEVGAPSVVALSKDTNTGSLRVLEKLGLAYERDVQLEGVTSMLFRGLP